VRDGVIPHALLTRKFLQTPEGNLISHPDHAIGAPVVELNVSMWHVDIAQDLAVLLKANTHAAALICDNCYELDDFGLDAIATCMERVQRLHLRNCYEITDIGLANIAQAHSMHLEHIDVSHCPRITDEGMTPLAACPNLTSLSCDGNANITDLSIQEIANRLRKLQKLSFVGCPNLTDEGMRIVLLECKTLQDVAFGNSHILGEAFVQMSIPGTVMPTELQSLISLNLSNSYHLMDNGLTW
jgi:hypothetical protein